MILKRFSAFFSEFLMQDTFS